MEASPRATPARQSYATRCPRVTLLLGTGRVLYCAKSIKPLTPLGALPNNNNVGLVSGVNPTVPPI
jgi:hypothetical protein